MIHLGLLSVHLMKSNVHSWEISDFLAAKCSDVFTNILVTVCLLMGGEQGLDGRFFKVKFKLRKEKLRN